MNTSQWPQEIVVKPNEEIIIPKQQQQQQQQKATRPQQKEQNLNCPRCNSTNTKFCYYNNYSLTQPRYFCKTCRRYWTNGGSLRNIPVGGGSRKNKRPSSSSSNTPSPSSKKQDLNLTFPMSTHQDFTSFSHDFSQMTKMPSSSTPSTSNITTTTNTNPHHHLSHLELLNGFSGGNSASGSSRGFGSFMHVGTSFPTTNSVVKISDLRNEDDMNMNNMVNYNASAGFHDHMQGLKQSSLNFTLDHHDGNIGSGGYDRNFHNRVMQESNNVDANSGRVLFPFEDLKQQASINTSAHQDVEEHDHGASSGYWTGMLGGGSW